MQMSAVHDGKHADFSGRRKFDSVNCMQIVHVLQMTKAFDILTRGESVSDARLETQGLFCTRQSRPSSRTHLTNKAAAAAQAEAFMQDKNLVECAENRFT